MAYTSEDIAKVEAAIVALAAGERVVSVTVRDRTTTWAQADIDKLRALKAEMQAEVNSATTRRRFVLTSTGKGL